MSMVSTDKNKWNFANLISVKKISNIFFMYATLSKKNLCM